MALYQRVPVSERRPKEDGYYDTDIGTAYIRKKIKHSIWEEWEGSNYPIYPSYWYEEITKQTAPAPDNR